ELGQRVGNPMAPRYETTRFRLRAIRDDDLPALLENFSDPALMRYYGMPVMRTPEEVRALVERWRGWETKGTGVRWAIARKDTDALIGTCGFHDLDRANGCVE